MNQPKIFAHRGLSSVSPENTLASIRAAIESDVDGVEFDVELSLDNQPVVIHQESFLPNPEFDSLTVVGEELRRSWVREHNLSQLLKLDAGRWFDAGMQGLRVCSLEEVLGLDWKGKTALLEVKDSLFWDAAESNEYHDLLVDSIKSHVQDFEAKGNKLNLLSFSRHVLKNFSKALPETVLVLVVSDFAHLDAALSSDIRHIGIVTMSETMALSDASAIQRVQEKGKQAYVYEHTRYNLTNSVSQRLVEREEVWQRLQAAGADGIISNYAQFFNPKRMAG